MHVLLLGGTADARRLAGRLAGRAGLRVTLSLAGRTQNPLLQPVPVRVGGFGGAQGLAEYLVQEAVGAVVDATHPYAAAISHNAAWACAKTGVPLLAFHRPPWVREPGDDWREARDVTDALAIVGRTPRRVFLALGRNEVRAIEAAPQHFYLVRSIDRVEPPLAVPHASYITARGPFAEADDREMLASHGIDVIVAKNSGGRATYGKIAAARALGIAVVLLKRPEAPNVPAVERDEAVLDWLGNLRHDAGSSALRGA